MAVPVALQALIERLAQLAPVRAFYLAGGTGLALHLGHRRSVDLDWFSRANRLDFEGRRSLLAQLKRLPHWHVIEAKDGTVHGEVGTVRVSWFWYPQPLVKQPVRRAGARIASLEDIGLMKLGAIIGRGSKKDFIDLYAICQRVPLARLLALGPRKFPEARDFPLQALKALCFFDDAERDPPSVTATSWRWDDIKRFFTREARALTQRSLLATR